jgi:[ribosomal protein S18]-alanine N-acetyltransferase
VPRRLPSWQNRGVSIVLQFASHADADDVAAMSRDLIEDGLGWRYRAPSVRRLIDDADTVTLVARDGAALAGFGIMKFGDERAHLVLLAVRTACQRRGIGSSLLQWLVESAATAGVASIHVELRTCNTGAHAFYLAQGFAETLRVPGYYSGREAAIRMLRMLRTPVAAVPKA